MSGLLPFIINGLVTGSVYGLVAMGLVLTYKTTGVFNFAHGAVATGAAYLFFELQSRNSVPWPVALLMPKQKASHGFWRSPWTYSV